MKNQLHWIPLFLIFSGCVSTNQNSWREVGSAEFERRAASEDRHGCIGQNAFMLKGFTLGEVSMRVEFANVRWSKQSDSLIVIGKVVDAMLAQPLAKVTVAFGRIDTVADAGRISSEAQTITDEAGQFYLASSMTTNGKLVFTYSATLLESTTLTM